MDVSSATTRTGRSPGLALPDAVLGTTATGWLLAVLLVLTAAFLLARRIGGALVEPLSPWALVFMGVVAVGAAISIRSLCPHGTCKWLLSASIVSIALAVSLPGSSWFGLTVMWLGIVGEEVWAWKPRRAPVTSQLDVAWRHAERQPTSHQPDGDAGDSPVTAPLADVERQSANAALDEPWHDISTTGQLNYTRSEQGGLAIEGWLRVEFSQGQRVAAAHAAFCPAFERSPQVEAEPLDGPACDIRATLVLPWGVRWEVKLDEAADESASVVLGFMASEQDE